MDAHKRFYFYIPSNTCKASAMRPEGITEDMKERRIDQKFSTGRSRSIFFFFFFFYANNQVASAYTY